MDTPLSVIVSGIQPSGRLHIGNYLGAIKQWLQLQEERDRQCYFFLADYHSIGGNYDPNEKRRQVFEAAVDLLALGVDPAKCTFFVQSQIPEHTELCWVFNTVTPVSFLERMTQFKDKSEQQAANINMGLFDYPVLQAADILMYQATQVPVGADQVQHVELTRDIAGFFNNKFGKTFTEPKPLLTETPRLMSLSDPAKKMSKSLGEKSYVAIFDEPEVIAEKLKQAVTTTEGIDNLLGLLKIFSRTVINADQYTNNNAGLKNDLAKAIAEYFAEARERRQQLLSDPLFVNDVLSAGAARAREVAVATMEQVRAKIGLR